MTAYLVERALLVKLFYENKGNASAAVHEIRRRRNLLREPMSTKVIRPMIKRFEETRKLGVQSRRGCTHCTPVLVDGAKTVVEAYLQASEFWGCNVRAVSRQTGCSYSIFRKVLIEHKKKNALLPIYDMPNPGAA
ncbi:hypothetical protein TNCV_3242641 [Trichonephila clavipes]|nr:hypothetical protein TNCV_3242641 [Trichonephila clavipes]